MKIIFAGEEVPLSEAVGSVVTLVAGAYVLFGMPAWMSLITGERVYLGILYEPVVNFLRSLF